MSRSVWTLPKLNPMSKTNVVCTKRTDFCEDFNKNALFSKSYACNCLQNVGIHKAFNGGTDNTSGSTRSRSDLNIRKSPVDAHCIKRSNLFSWYSFLWNGRTLCKHNY